MTILALDLCQDNGTLAWKVQGRLSRQDFELGPASLRSPSGFPSDFSSLISQIKAHLGSVNLKGSAVRVSLDPTFTDLGSADLGEVKLRDAESMMRLELETVAPQYLEKDYRTRIETFKDKENRVRTLWSSIQKARLNQLKKEFRSLGPLSLYDARAALIETTSPSIVIYLHSSGSAIVGRGSDGRPFCNNLTGVQNELGRISGGFDDQNNLERLVEQPRVMAAVFRIIAEQLEKVAINELSREATTHATPSVHLYSTIGDAGSQELWNQFIENNAPVGIDYRVLEQGAPALNLLSGGAPLNLATRERQRIPATRAFYAAAVTLPVLTGLVIGGLTLKNASDVSTQNARYAQARDDAAKLEPYKTYALALAARNQRTQEVLASESSLGSVMPWRLYLKSLSELLPRGPGGTPTVRLDRIRLRETAPGAPAPVPNPAAGEDLSVTDTPVTAEINGQAASRGALTNLVRTLEVARGGTVTVGAVSYAQGNQFRAEVGLPRITLPPPEAKTPVKGIPGTATPPPASTPTPGSHP